ncbi:MAG: hypothetical protein RMK50_04605 [Nitrososphaerota archaeon]|nr:hypothetical protein [Candidatus Bathyarchaeota archaeon]MDW8194080.1 hypothetical protein [Nitrososphaerota archaeon]
MDQYLFSIRFCHWRLPFAAEAMLLAVGNEIIPERFERQEPSALLRT